MKIGETPSRQKGRFDNRPADFILRQDPVEGRKETDLLLAEFEERILIAGLVFEVVRKIVGGAVDFGYRAGEEEDDEEGSEAKIRYEEARFSGKKAQTTAQVVQGQDNGQET